MTAANSEAGAHELPVLPLRTLVPYPLVVLPLTLEDPGALAVIQRAFHRDRSVGLLACKTPDLADPTPDALYQVGCMARVMRLIPCSECKLHVVLESTERVRVSSWRQEDSLLMARVELAPDEVRTGLELEAQARTLRDLAQQVVSLIPNLPSEVGTFLGQLEDPRKLLYVVLSNSRLEVAQGQRILELDCLNNKYPEVIAYLMREMEVLTLGQKIQAETKEKLGKAHKDFFLRQQIKTIQEELGEGLEPQSDSTEYAERIEQSSLPEEARREAKRELGRLQGLPAQAAEASVIKTYLDWLLDLPWTHCSEDNLEITNARRVLDEDHYDLQEVKERIIEFLAVRKLTRERGLCVEPDVQNRVLGTGVILCFVGPPGVGKTSLGQSIARALQRKFTRMSLGAVRDEAEIRGHRRTYVGAMPGRIIQAIRRAGTRNPVFMLDELDKMGADWRGDPSSALLEVLDPAQNHTFRDHYLDLDFNLSDVMFITTANQLEPVPPALRDRLEVIRLEGYTEQEKLCIARAFLVPRQVRHNGLLPQEISFSDQALLEVIRHYTREAGVRTLERLIGTICRKVVVRVAAGESSGDEIAGEGVRRLLRGESFELQDRECLDIPGIATGLAVTAAGGDLLLVEASRMPGKGQLTLTGHLGEVMRESAQIAHSYVRSRAQALGLPPVKFDELDLHLHVPAGATPKDGPSAGIAMVAAITSLLREQPVRSDVGLTGEVTLRGRVLPVGGLKLKVLAAHRAGITTVVLPRKNEQDLERLPAEVRQALHFVPVERIDQALEVALSSARAQAAGSR